MRILRACAALGLLGVLTLLVSAASAQTGGPPAARALGYAALLPSGTQGAASASTPGGTSERTAQVAGLRPTGGGTVGGVSVRVAASASGLTGRAEGTVTASGLTLLDGRVAIAQIRFSAVGGAGPDAPAAALTDASVSGVTVDGQAVTAAPGGSVEVPGIGRLVFVEQAPDGAGGISVNGLRVEVTDPTAAQTVGQPFVVGHLELSATAGTAPAATAPVTTAPATTAPSTTAPSTTTTRPSTEPATTTAPRTAPAPLGLPRRIAPPVTIDGDGAYVFPVVGDSSFSDDYGAPRAGTGWHHGNDIFADRGTPVVAIADGRLSRVGVNTLGGNRLWLTDDAGNAFYYAHLSAYAPAALEGARVRRGQVIAFVGNTGQAITTPPHLHFEIHPGGEENESVNPYPYLLAWKRGTDLPKAFQQASVSTSPAPAAGAVLVDGVPESDEPPAGEGAGGPATPAT